MRARGGGRAQPPLSLDGREAPVQVRGAHLLFERCPFQQRRGVEHPRVEPTELREVVVQFRQGRPARSAQVRQRRPAGGLRLGAYLVLSSESPAVRARDRSGK